MMKLIAAICLLPMLFCYAVYGREPDTVRDDSGDLTVITSERLTFDYQQGFALFEQDVKVDDPELTLFADQLRVEFDDNDDVRLIVASGSVEIRQEARIAFAGMARYELQTGKILLEDNPRVQRGGDVLSGDTITFWRDDNKMICEPRARLIVYPREDGPREQLFGE